MTESTSNPPSKRKLVVGGALAVIGAAAILLLFVLPAEFGVDPLGTGTATGLSDLSKAGEMTELERGALRKGVLSLTDRAMLTDQWEIELRPYEAVEFKYTLAKGAPMVFTWQATAKVKYDMHSHPFEGGEALTESYGVGEADRMQGVYLAPFTGIHGWYWQNRTLEDVTLRLNASGAFTTSTVFDGAGQHKRAIDQSSGPSGAAGTNGSASPEGSQPRR